MASAASSSGSLVGVELEWHLVDAHTFALKDATLELFPDLDEDAPIKPEFLQCAVEVTGGPAERVTDLRAPLLANLRALRARCTPLGVRLCGGATPASPCGLRAVTPKPRYFEAAHLGGYVCERFQTTCALHVHVGVPSLEAGLGLARRLRGSLPVLLALSSASPFWDGQDTGFASFRHRLLATTPDYGPPPDIGSPDELEQILEVARRASIGTGYRDLHWELRPRPDFGTLELRVYDAQPTVSSSLALAAVAHALFVAAERGQPPLDDVLVPPLPAWLERQNGFRASRFGLDAELIVDENGGTRGARELAMILLQTLAPVAIELGARNELEDAIDLALHGAWADRMRALYVEHGSLARTTEALCDMLDDELEEPEAVRAVTPIGRELR